jgi:hypothetical protein
MDITSCGQIWRTSDIIAHAEEATRYPTQFKVFSFIPPPLSQIGRGEGEAAKPPGVG